MNDLFEALREDAESASNGSVSGKAKKQVKKPAPSDDDDFFADWD